MDGDCFVKVRSTLMDGYSLAPDTANDQRGWFTTKHAGFRLHFFQLRLQKCSLRPWLTLVQLTIKVIDVISVCSSIKLDLEQLKMHDLWDSRRPEIQHTLNIRKFTNLYGMENTWVIINYQFFLQEIQKKKILLSILLLKVSKWNDNECDF